MMNIFENPVLARGLAIAAAIFAIVGTIAFSARLST